MRYFQYNIDDEFAHSVVSLKGTKKYYIEGYASTIDKDKAGETLLQSAQQDLYAQLKGENITLDVEHEEWYDENKQVMRKPGNNRIPVAKVVDAKIDNKGVWIKAELNTHISRFQEVWGSIKDGFLKAFSVAFYPTHNVTNGLVRSLNLVNITLTGSPVNPNATFAVTMKSASAYMDSNKSHSPETYTPDAPSPSTPGIPNDIDIKNTNEVNKMESEEKKLTPEEEEKKKKESTEDKKEDAVEDKKDEPKVKAIQDYEAEIKEMAEKYEAKIKALEVEMTAKTEEAVKLKAELEKPIMKATVTEVPVIKADFKIRSPLGLIN